MPRVLPATVPKGKGPSFHRLSLLKLSAYKVAHRGENERHCHLLPRRRARRVCCYANFQISGRFKINPVHPDPEGGDELEDLSRYTTGSQFQEALAATRHWPPEI